MLLLFVDRYRGWTTAGTRDCNPDAIAVESSPVLEPSPEAWLDQILQEDASDLRSNRKFILGSLSAGHGISHLFVQGFPLLLTEISAAFGFSNLQNASVFAARQVGSGVVNLGGGPLVDMLKSHWGTILTGCMLFHAITFALAGATPNYVFLLIISLFIAVPGSLWHLPAAAAISQRFPDRRGFAVTMHGFGANIGNVLGPLMTGGVLGLVTWRPTFFIYVAPYVAATLLVWWSLKSLGRSGDDEAKPKPLTGQFKDSARLLRNPLVMGLFGAAMLRSIGLSTVNNWTPFYLREPIEDGGLAMGSLEAGFYLSLLTGVGILSTPILGLLSDRYGRKAVLVPGFAAAAALSMLVVSAGDSSRWMLGLVLAGMGIFTFALHQIIQASVLDVVGRGTEAKAIGLMFGLSGMLGVATPFIASLIIDNLGGFGSIFYYAGILTAVTAVLVFIIPFRQTPGSVSPGH